MARPLWTSLRPLAEDVDLHRLDLIVTTGGNRRQIFTRDPIQTELVIRPWQSDQYRVVNEGELGETPGLKAFAGLNADTPAPRRGDRIHYEGQAWRVTNPQVSTAEELISVDLRTDEREFDTRDDIQYDAEGNIAEEYRKVDPDRGQFEQY